jgi:hypothetical protein
LENQKERQGTCGEIRHRLGDIFDLLVNHLIEFESDTIAHENGINAEKARPLALFSRSAGKKALIFNAGLAIPNSGDLKKLAPWPSSHPSPF